MFKQDRRKKLTGAAATLDYIARKSEQAAKRKRAEERAANAEARREEAEAERRMKARQRQKQKVLKEIEKQDKARAKYNMLCEKKSKGLKLTDAQKSFMFDFEYNLKVQSEKEKQQLNEARKQKILDDIQELEEFIEKNPLVKEDTSVAAHFTGAVIASGIIAAVLMLIVWLADRTMIALFDTRFATMMETTVDAFYYGGFIGLTMGLIVLNLQITPRPRKSSEDQVKEFEEKTKMLEELKQKVDSQ